MWQEPWGKVELLFVMWIDEPKFLVCYREAALVYESFKQLYTCSAFFYAHKFIHSSLPQFGIKKIGLEFGSLQYYSYLCSCKSISYEQ